MTIDEAIAHAREVASRKFDDRVHCIRCAEEHEQLAEWLEELKAYRASVFSGDMTQKMLKEEYCKAVDDLLENANEMCVEVDMGTYTMKAIGIGLLEQIAEQLKVGDGE